MNDNPNLHPQLKPLKRKPPIYRAVQEEIKDYIIRNGLQPSDQLPPETELAQQLNISRNSVREAVKSLTALGILEARPGTGLFVCDFSFDPLLDNLAYGILFDLKQLADILEVRSHIEFGMAQRVAQAVTPGQLRRLHEVLGQMRSAAELGVYSADADRKFHQILHANVSNNVVRKLIDIFWKVFHMAQQRASIPEPNNPMDTYECHSVIVKALKDRNVEAMQAAIARHYTGIQERLRQMQLIQNERPR